MSIPEYADHRDTGVEWIGMLPAHWTVRRIKHTAYLKGRVGWKGLTSEEYLDDGFAYLVTGTDFSNRYVDWSACCYVSQDRYEDDPFIHLRNDDLLITKDGTIGKLALVAGLDKPACLNSGIFLVRPVRDYETRFLYWVLSSTVFQRFCDLASFGSTIQHLYQNVFENFSFPVPCTVEQLKIADFLDHETATIDALIAQQERLLALAAEKRQATISHAVTRGLDPAAPMKDTGVAWMNEVPLHWVVAKLGHFASIENGTTPSRAVDEYWQGGDIPWLASGEVNQLRITEASEFITKTALANCSLRLLPPGTVVVGMIGQGKTRGMSAMLCIPAAINQNLAAISPGKRLDGEYVLYVMHAVYEWLREAGRGGNQAAMNCEILSGLRIPVPKVEEQREIVSYIQTETSKLDAIKAEAERAIVLLKERRSALITAAITGKFDVRGLSLAQEEA